MFHSRIVILRVNEKKKTLPEKTFELMVYLLHAWFRHVRLHVHIFAWNVPLHTRALISLTPYPSVHPLHLPKLHRIQIYMTSISTIPLHNTSNHLHTYTTDSPPNSATLLSRHTYITPPGASARFDSLHTRMS
jgi:hypothetical protein